MTARQIRVEPSPVPGLGRIAIPVPAGRLQPGESPRWLAMAWWPGSDLQAHMLTEDEVAAWLLVEVDEPAVTLEDYVRSHPEPDQLAAVAIEAAGGVEHADSCWVSRDVHWDGHGPAVCSCGAVVARWQALRAELGCGS